MKTSIKLLFSILLTTAATVASAQGFKIEVMVHNSTDSIAYLGHHFATQRYIDDTAKVVAGKTIFTGSNTLPDGIYFYYTPSTYFEFLIGNQKFSIETSANDVAKSIKFSHSAVNDGFIKMQSFTTARRLESKSILKLIDEIDDEPRKNILRDSLKLLNDQVLAFQIELQKEYPGTMLDRMIRIMQTPQVPPAPEGVDDEQLFNYLYYKAHFWDGIDIADPGLLRTPLLHSKITAYLDNVVIQQPDSVIAAVDYILQTAKRNPESYRYALITLANKYETSPVMGFDAVFVHIVDEYYLNGTADWVDEETIENLRNRTASIKPNLIGKPAPPLSLWDTLGNKVNVMDVDALYTVLYFYDPDCGHCKTKTPILYAEYPELRAKGVEILAICTTTDQKRWQEFIVENDLTWINLADLNSETYFKFYYDIRSTPTIYILDKNKKIIVKKIDAEQIPEVIDDLIARGL